jgi:3-methyl-2-oxobutanoate hydroxymethyltransferase
MMRLTPARPVSETGPADTAPCTAMNSAKPHTAASQKVTILTLAEKKLKRQPISCLTAYDYATARIVDEAGIDLVLVGDSLAMVMQGHESTLPVTMDEMLLYTRGVRRAVRRALLVADMPYGSYHTTDAAAVENAVRFMKEAGAEAVKIEGGIRRAPLVERLVEAEIPVLGHIGLTPQSVHQMGGYKVQGRTTAAIDALLSDARALEHAGAFAIVLEGIPREVAAQITAELTIPTIGIGAGPECDGQVLVVNDLLGLTFAPQAKFVRRYAALGDAMREAATQYRLDVESRNFPSDAESYHLPAAVRETFEESAMAGRSTRGPRRHA